MPWVTINGAHVLVGEDRPSVRGRRGAFRLRRISSGRGSTQGFGDRKLLKALRRLQSKGGARGTPEAGALWARGYAASLGTGH